MPRSRTFQLGLILFGQFQQLFNCKCGSSTTFMQFQKPISNRMSKHEISHVCTFILFLWLFPSCRVAGITDDLSSPHHPVRLLARSQSTTFQISLTRVFPSCFQSSSLPFPWYIRPQHFPQYVFAISPRTFL